MSDGIILTRAGCLVGAMWIVAQSAVPVPAWFSQPTATP